MSNSRLPAIVILPADNLDALAVTLGSVAAVLPKADIHIARPGVPSLDAVADMVASAGLQVIDTPSECGFDAVLAALDARFDRRPYCWLFAGEELRPDHARLLDSVGQLAQPEQLAWLEHPSPMSAGRVRAAGVELRSSRRGQLGWFLPCASWRATFLTAVRAAFASYTQVYEDVCLLVHMSELDAAFQRAELSWKAAEEIGDLDSSLRLARASVMLASMLGISTTSISACAQWFRLEPEPFVALMYVRVAESAIPFSLIDGLLALVPTFGPVVYGAGLHVEPVENVVAVRTAVAQHRQSATLRLDAALRLIRAAHATPGEIGNALTLSFALGTPPTKVIDALPAGDQNPMLGDCINVNLDVAFVATCLSRMHDRFAGQFWLDQLVQRFVLTRNVDAALALDGVGLHAYRHWSMLANVSWMPDDVRSRSLVLAVVHGELDRDVAADRFVEIDADGYERFAELLLEEVPA